MLWQFATFCDTHWQLDTSHSCRYIVYNAEWIIGIYIYNVIMDLVTNTNSHMICVNINTKWSFLASYDTHNSVRQAGMTCFFNQTLQLLFILLHVFVRLLFEGGVYFFGKPPNTNNSWIRYIQTIQWRLLDTVISKRSLSVLLSAMENDSYNTNSPSASPVIVIRNYLHVCATYSSHGFYWAQCLFCSKLRIVRRLFQGGVYSKEVYTTEISQIFVFAYWNACKGWKWG